MALPASTNPVSAWTSTGLVQAGQVVGQLVEPVWVEHAADLLVTTPANGGRP